MKEEEKLWSVDIAFPINYKNVLFSCKEDDIQDHVYQFMRDEVSPEWTYEKGDPTNRHTEEFLYENFQEQLDITKFVKDNE